MISLNSNLTHPLRRLPYSRGQVGIARFFTVKCLAHNFFENVYLSKSKFECVVFELFNFVYYKDNNIMFMMGLEDMGVRYSILEI